MTIDTTADRFYNKTVVDYHAGDDVQVLESQVYRLALDYDDEGEALVDLLREFLAKADKSQLDALVIGMWNEPYEESVQDVLDLLVAEKDNLPALKALFVGDMTYEQCEISWIIQGSYKALLDAFPQLEVLRIRGSSELSIAPFQHLHLQQLIIECGGLPMHVFEHLAQSDLTALNHLELWLGDSNYGFDGHLDLCTELLEKMNPGRFRYLGLRDSEISDGLAKYIAQQPWLAKLHTLDLSLGTLGDEGALALINSPYINELQVLNVSYHFLSDDVLTQLLALPIVVIADDQQVEEDYGRYVAVGE